jgi:hypothetical protein
MSNRLTTSWKCKRRLRVASRVEDIYLLLRPIHQSKVFAINFVTAKAYIACLNYVEKARKAQRLNSMEAGKSET